MHETQLESPKLRTLLVDDEEPIRSLLIELLEELPLEIVEAKDGREAWDIFQREKFDLVITDIHMPIMNGLVLAEKIIAKDYSVPVLMVTAFDDKDRVLKALQIGVTDFITKPVIGEFMIDRVRRAIDKRNLILAEMNVINLLHEMMGIPNDQAIEQMSLQERLEYIHELVAVVSIKRERELCGHK